MMSPHEYSGGGLNRMDFQGLTPELLRLFIQKNLVHGREMEQTRPADGGDPCSGGGRAGGQADAPQRAKVHDGNLREVLPKQDLPGVRASK